MNILVIGAGGFIGSNLVVRLQELEHSVILHTREHSDLDLNRKLTNADVVFHLAGVNRPKDDESFHDGNAVLTRKLCETLIKLERKVPLIFTSSIQASLDNPYGASKRDAEQEIISLHKQFGNPVYIFRLPNIFGKWCRPNYNSVVATFCYSIINELPIRIDDPAVELSLAHIDHVIDCFVDILNEKTVTQNCFVELREIYKITLKQLSEVLFSFKESRNSLVTEPVGSGLTRLLYSTYLSYSRPENFSYKIPFYKDERGVFVEMLKTNDSGQFSFFTAHPGITRGGHYHHCKTEKFLVIKGKARFGFRHIATGETYELFTEGNKPEIVETVPGWSHDVTNVGDDEMVVMLWANEIFDRDKPDTIAHPV